MSQSMPGRGEVQRTLQGNLHIGFSSCRFCRPGAFPFLSIPSLYPLRRRIGLRWDFPGGPVVKNLLSTARVSGSIPDQGTEIPHAMGQLSPGTATRSPRCGSFSQLWLTLLTLEPTPPAPQLHTKTNNRVMSKSSSLPHPVDLSGNA